MKRTKLIHHVPAVALTLWTLCGCQSAPPPALQIGLNFTASTLGVDTQTTLPADTTGAVGAHHLVELINGRYSVYRKSDGTLVQSRVLEQFWRDTGAGSDQHHARLARGIRSVQPALVRHGRARRIARQPEYHPARGIALCRSHGRMDRLQHAQRSTPRATLGDFPGIGVDADGVYIRAGIGTPRTASR